MRVLIALAATLVLAGGCAHLTPVNVIPRDLLIDISVQEPFRGTYRWTATYTTGEAFGRVHRTGIDPASRRISAGDVRWLAAVVETELLAIESAENSGCSDCLTIVVLSRLGADARTARIVIGTLPSAVQKILDRIDKRG